jgi:lysophospholipase L1-like esterase
MRWTGPRTAAGAALWCCALLVAGEAATATASATAGTSARASTPDSAQARTLAAAAADPSVITFDDLALNITVSDQYLSFGVRFTSDAFISEDGSNPTAPVLSGVPQYQGPIHAVFTVPGSAEPATVDGFSLDVGYINSRDSVVVDYFDASGQVVGSVPADSLGINHLTIAYRGVRGFDVHTVADEPAGFAIDNLKLQSGAEGITPTRVASLGDSYSAGEGLLRDVSARYDCGTDLHEGLYYQDTTLAIGGGWNAATDCDTRTLSSQQPNLAARPLTEYKNLCHRNGRAYPNQVRTALGVSGPAFLFVACSGATTANVGFAPRTKAQYPDSPVNVHGGHVQIDDVETWAQGGDPDLITVGVGGNDAGFAGIIAHCLALSCASDTSFAAGAINKINGAVYDNLRDVFAGLRSDFPAATILAFGYPSVIGDIGLSCAGIGVGPFSIGEADREWIKDDLLPALNGTIRDAAAASGVTFVDITQATAGHEVCTSDAWINGARVGNDKFGVVANESFHPNQYGHDAIASYFIAHYTDGHRLIGADPNASDPIRPAPGQPITVGSVSAGAVQACGAQCLQPAWCVQACSLHVQLNDFASDTVLSVTMHSDPVNLGSVTTDADGSATADLQLPPGAEPGIHVLEFDGTSPDGERQVGTAFIHIYETDPDTQVPTGQGPVGGAAQSGQSASAPSASNPLIVRARVRVLGWFAGRLYVRVSCPKQASSTCKVALTARLSVHGRRRVLGRTTVKVTRGHTRLVGLRAGKTARGRRGLSVRLVTTTSAGSTSKTQGVSTGRRLTRRPQ